MTGPGAPAARWSFVLTRPDPSDPALAEALARAGCKVIAAPATELVARREAADLERLRDELQSLGAARGWLILPSPSAIRFFGQSLAALGWTVGNLAGIRLAAVGEASARGLAALALHADFVPPDATGHSLAGLLPAAPGDSVLVVGSSQSRPELREGLARRGLSVRHVALYEPRPCERGLTTIREALAARPERLVVTTAPSGAEAIIRDMIRHGFQWPHVRWVAIGPTTAHTLAELSVAPDALAVAAEPTAPAILAAVSRWVEAGAP